MYLKGIDKFSQEIDLVYHIKSLRQLQTLMSSLMNFNDKYLSVYQHQNTLKLSDCNLCQNDASDEDSIPRLISSKDKISDFKQEVDGFFSDNFQRKLNTKDLKLLKGVLYQENLDKNEDKNLQPIEIYSINEETIQNKDDLHIPESNSIELFGQDRSNVLVKKVKNSDKT